MAIQSSKHKGKCVISLSSDPIPTSRLGRRSCRNRTWRMALSASTRSPGLGPTHISNGPMSVLYEASIDRSFPMWNPPPPNPLCRPFCRPATSGSCRCSTPRVLAQMVHSREFRLGKDNEVRTSVQPGGRHVTAHECPYPFWVIWWPTNPASFIQPCAYP